MKKPFLEPAMRCGCEVCRPKQLSHIWDGSSFLKYINDRPIEEMGEIEIREYLLYLSDSGHSAGTVNVSNSALRFIFGAVLGRNLNYQLIHRRREYRESPALMSKKELAHFFSSMDNLRDRAVFETVYGAGLCLSEITYLRVQDIDSLQMRIFVHHGKGGKDRYTLLSHRNLEVLREYWREYRPNQKCRMQGNYRYACQWQTR